MTVKTHGWLSLPDERRGSYVVPKRKESPKDKDKDKIKIKVRTLRKRGELDVLRMRKK